MKQTITKTEREQLVKIATTEIFELAGRTDLNQHFSDSEDFFETSVWGLEAALIAAYELGKKNGKK